MSQEQRNDSQNNSEKGGRPETLDEFKIGRIVGLISVGASRRAAARSVGCHVSTISRRIARDPNFARRMMDAETLCQTRPMQAMHLALEKNWRAAAWLLERLQPEQFAKRAPKTYTLVQVREVVDRILEEVLPRVADEAAHDEIRQTADRYVEEIEQPKQAKPVNPLLEWAKMDEELEEHKRQKEAKTE